MNRHMQITSLEDELTSNKCYCGRGKLPGRTFCAPCYLDLPVPMRRALYTKIGNGYEDARKAAFEYLQNVRTRQAGR